MNPFIMIRKKSNSDDVAVLQIIRRSEVDLSQYTFVAMSDRTNLEIWELKQQAVD